MQADGFTIANFYLELGFEVPEGKLTREYFLSNNLKPKILQKIGNNIEILPEHLDIISTWVFDPVIEIYNRYLDIFTTYHNYGKDEGDLSVEILTEMQNNIKEERSLNSVIGKKKEKNIINFVLTLADGQKFYCSALTYYTTVKLTVDRSYTSIHNSHNKQYVEKKAKYKGFGETLAGWLFSGSKCFKKINSSAYSSTLGQSSDLIIDEFIYVPRSTVQISSNPCYGVFSKVQSFYHGYIIFPEQSGLCGIEIEINDLLQKVKKKQNYMQPITTKIESDKRKKIVKEIKKLCYDNFQYWGLAKSNSLYFPFFKEFFISLQLFYKIDRKQNIISNSQSLIKATEINQICDITTNSNNSFMLNYNFFDMNMLAVKIEPNFLCILMCSIQLERRILIIHKNTSMIPILVESIFTLISPFEWKGIYIPNLQPQLAKCAQGFMPMILGVHTELFKAIKKEYGVDEFDIFDLNTSDFRINNKDVNINIRRFLYDKLIASVTNFLHNKRQIELDSYKPEFYNMNDNKSKKKNSKGLSNIENFMKFRSEIMVKLLGVFKSQIFCFKVISPEQKKNFRSLDTKQIFDFAKFIKDSKKYWIEYGNFHAVEFYKLICDTQYFNVFVSECYNYFLQSEENVATQFVKQLLTLHGGIKIDFSDSNDVYFVDKNEQEKFDMATYETSQKESQQNSMQSARSNYLHIDLYVEYVLFLAINNYYIEPADGNSSLKLSKADKISRGAYTMSALGGKIKEDIIIGLNKEKLVDLEKQSLFIFEKNLQSSQHSWEKEKQQKKQAHDSKKDSFKKSKKHSPTKSFHGSPNLSKSETNPKFFSSINSPDKITNTHIGFMHKHHSAVTLSSKKGNENKDPIDKHKKEMNVKEQIVEEVNSDSKQVDDIIDFLNF